MALGGFIGGKALKFSMTTNKTGGKNLWEKLSR